MELASCRISMDITCRRSVADIERKWLWKLNELRYIICINYKLEILFEVHERLDLVFGFCLGFYFIDSNPHKQQVILFVDNVEK